MPIPLTGDDLYGKGEPEELDFETTGKMQNRIGFVSPVLTRVLCNVENPHGHRKPIHLVDMMMAEKVNETNDHKKSSNL